MAKIHIVLQGKGGVGKSVVAAIIAQLKVSKGGSPLCLNFSAPTTSWHPPMEHQGRVY